MFGWEESQLGTIAAVEAEQTSWQEKLQIWPGGRLPLSCNSTRKQTGQDLLLLLHPEVKNRPSLTEAHIRTLPRRGGQISSSVPVCGVKFNVV